MSQVLLRPLLLQIAPALNYEQFDDLIGIEQEAGLSGVVATNTPIDRSGLRTPGVEQRGAGGPSGALLRARATEAIRYLHQELGGAFPIIGGGRHLYARRRGGKADRRRVAGAALHGL
ncbi:hypothetical protein GCM10027048_13110 [Hymenobacter coalescens]